MDLPLSKKKEKNDHCFYILAFGSFRLLYDVRTLDRMFCVTKAPAEGELM